MTDLAKKLPEFIGFPIVLHVENSKEKAVTDSGEDEQEVEGKEGGEPKFEEINETVFEEKEKKTEKVKVVSHEWENVPVMMQRCCWVPASVKVPQIQFIAGV